MTTPNPEYSVNQCDPCAPEVQTQVIAILTALHMTDSDSPPMLLAVALRLLVVASRVVLASGSEVGTFEGEANRIELLRAIEGIAEGIRHEDPKTLREVQAAWNHQQMTMRQKPGHA